MFKFEPDKETECLIKALKQKLKSKVKKSAVDIGQILTQIVLLLRKDRNFAIDYRVLVLESIIRKLQLQVEGSSSANLQHAIIDAFKEGDIKQNIFINAMRVISTWLIAFSTVCPEILFYDQDLASSIQKHLDSIRKGFSSACLHELSDASFHAIRHRHSSVSFSSISFSESLSSLSESYQKSSIEPQGESFIPARPPVPPLLLQRIRELRENPIDIAADPQLSHSKKMGSG